MRKTFKYRLYPTGNQEQALDAQLGEACRLYNAALQERRDAYQQAGISLSYYDQANQLKDIRAEEACGLANFSCSQDVLRRMDKTFKAFFRRVQNGETPGYPRFKPRSRYDSITFPSYGDGARLRDNGKLYVQGVGEIKVKLHRPVTGYIKTVTIKREAGRWHVCFSVEMTSSPDTRLYEDVGIDLGLSSFAVLSDGSVIQNPRPYRQAQAKLRIAQRRVARRKRWIERQAQSRATFATGSCASSQHASEFSPPGSPPFGRSLQRHLRRRFEHQWHGSWHAGQVRF